MMNKIIFTAAISAYIIFIFRFSWHFIVWIRASGRAGFSPLFLKKTPVPVYISALLDNLFFRRLFNSDKLLWICSWSFHLSFLFVLIRHMRYAFPSLPDCLIFLQPVGIFAGYLLSISLFCLIMLRAVRAKNRYTSVYNYFLSGILLIISTTGLIMRNFSSPDLVAVKHFVISIFSLQPQELPHSTLVLVHGGIFIMLLPWLPTHILAAPLVNIEANRRKAELRFIIHEE